ncbi:hypothetical protein [Candidatus Marinarcus aquaticus]|uniref:Type II secretion system protein J n=1 Tax=Candidatus Marinarcus aquaticus TaxID=2044504 RepID=A0A4Q0XWD5_9BACT|nr:hypothetical protein [Candidatus Marinarcus aquaticus]RXJ60549.1 hypothetical protein CRV04_00600 [Candidatus Marinarcus aquaticus]
MKRSVVLFELIITLIILSSATLFALQFYKQLHETHTSEYLQQRQHINLQSSKLFLTHLFANSVLFHANNTTLTFHQKAQTAFKQNLYSGIIDLNQSSKEKAFSANSKLGQLHNIYAVYFNEQFWYELEPFTQDEFLHFKNAQSSKTLFEHYHLIFSQSRLYIKNKQLFLNGALLLEEVNAFNVTQQNNTLLVNLCHKNLCVDWRFKI